MKKESQRMLCSPAYLSSDWLDNDLQGTSSIQIAEIIGVEHGDHCVRCALVATVFRSNLQCLQAVSICCGSNGDGLTSCATYPQNSLILRLLSSCPSRRRNAHLAPHSAMNKLSTAVACMFNDRNSNTRRQGVKSACQQSA